MIALVTGGRRGIGLAIVRALQAHGYTVAVAALSSEGPGDRYIQADLSSYVCRHNLIGKVVSIFGGIDLLVNNAGAQDHKPAVELDNHQWDYALSLMLTAPFDLSRQFAQVTEKGHITNILSTSAFQGARDISAYVAAKHGLLGLTRALAIEFAPQIHVNAVAPGLTETDMTAAYITPERRRFLEAITPSGRFSMPEEIADAVLFLANSTNMYGQVITVDGGWMAKNG